ncbi:MAG: APC family permease [Elusimicrobiaceae bacterium]|nr:APC family permease [Elusimicrobiaceae bacterium]
MNLYTRQSLPNLWLYSFSVTNRALPRLLAIVLGTFLLLSAMGFVVFRFVVPNLDQSIGAPLIVLLILGLWLIVVPVCTSIISALSVRVLCDTALEKKTLLSEMLQDSLKPAFSLFVAGLVISIVSIPISYIAHKSQLLGGILNLVLFFVFYIRFTYLQGVIVCRRTGPIEGLVESWRLTSGNGYVDTLLMWILIFVTCVIYGIMIALCIGSLYFVIPLHFANWFDLSQGFSGWLVLGLLGLLILFFLTCQVWAFILVTYLNRDQSLYTFSPETSVPLPAVNVNAFEADEHVEDGLPPDARPAGNTPTGNTPRSIDLENLQVTSSSVNTQEHDEQQISEHLKQVYTPDQKHEVQKGDEDRMPTILFDDLMAQELEKNAQAFAPKEKTDSDPDEDIGSIKMSK